MFQRGRNAFRYGDYDQAVSLLGGLLSPKVLLDSSEDVHEALELLGIAGHMRGDTDTARSAFVRLLTLEPDARLDPLVAPPQVVDFFDALRSDLAAKLERYRLQQELERRTRELRAREAAPRRLVVEEVTVDRRHYWVNFVPLGAGQFQLDRKGWGIFFLGGQSLALGTNLAASALVETSRNPDGTHPPEDFRRARDLYQPLQLASLIAFGVLAGWGIVDALVNWVPYVKRVRRWEEELPGHAAEEPYQSDEPRELREQPRRPGEELSTPAELGRSEPGVPFGGRPAGERDPAAPSGTRPPVSASQREASPRPATGTASGPRESSTTPSDDEPRPSDPPAAPLPSPGP